MNTKFLAGAASYMVKLPWQLPYSAICLGVLFFFHNFLFKRTGLYVFFNLISAEILQDYVCAQFPH
jgi:hypothetical protein